VPHDRTLDDLQELILGAPRVHTRDELERLAGVTDAASLDLWRAMGFGDVGEERAFTDADLTAVLRLKALVDRGLLDWGTALDLTRSLGQTTARLSDWQVDALGRRLVAAGEMDVSDGLHARELGTVYDDAAAVMPVLEQLLVYAWRRQMAASAARWVADADERITEGEATATVAFADLVRFTRLSRQLEGGDLARLVERFETTSADVVAATGARLVKTLGDEVLFVADYPEQAAEAALRLHETHARDSAVPQMRIGIATGVVVNRMGDVFGTTVNLASRLTALARRGSTLVDSHSAHALERMKPFRVRPLTPRPVRGVGIIRPFVLTRGRRPSGK
jgi:adenylate cyclase